LKKKELDRKLRKKNKKSKFGQVGEKKSVIGEKEN